MGSETDVRHGQLQAAGRRRRPSLPLCFSVAEESVLAVRPSFVWIDSESDVTHGQLQAAAVLHGVSMAKGSVFGARVSSFQKVRLATASCGANRPSLPWCCNVAEGSVLGALGKQ